MKVEGAYPADEYSNFNSTQSFGSQQAPTPENDSGVKKALAEKEHLKTELINESMQSLELRQQITDLKRQLAEERAKTATAPK
jgi:predicted  nucleic acid-binding Zn-ribbon protein